MAEAAGAASGAEAAEAAEAGEAAEAAEAAEVAEVAGRLHASSTRVSTAAGASAMATAETAAAERRERVCTARRLDEALLEPARRLSHSSAMPPRVRSKGGLEGEGEVEGRARGRG